MAAKCPRCESTVSYESKYCNVCGAEIPNETKSFVYDQLFELMKLENERRIHLDSKANTYIGLLSIAVTFFGVLGGLLTADQISFLKTLNYMSVIMLYALYILIICAFIVGILFAFNAYHIGSPIIDENDRQKVDELIRSKKLYIKLKHSFVYDLLNSKTHTTKDDLMDQLIYIIDVNNTFNIKKSNNIIWSFRFTIASISLILIMTIYLSIISINALS